MPHAYAKLICACGEKREYHCHSHDDDSFIETFYCKDFKVSSNKKTRFGLLLGFDQLAGLYFNISCLNCSNERKISYEAKTFGKVKRDDFFHCCGNRIDFHFDWAH